MADIEIRIPQLGEGLQEARLVRFLKQPGEPVHRDEPIYEMETDKAVMEIESPAAGILAEWTAKEDDVLPIGAAIGRISTSEESYQSSDISDQSGRRDRSEVQNPKSRIQNASDFEIRIPQLGEGLQEARIVRFLKEVGETVARDEPIYEMETDKAVMEVESPAAGVLQEWTASPDDVVAIGAKIGAIRTETAVTLADEGTLLVSERPIPGTAGKPAEAEPASAPPVRETSEGPPRNRDVPPRTRAYAFQHGLTEGQLLGLARGTDGKLLPEDIDRFLAHGGATTAAHVATRRTPDIAYQDTQVPGRQRTFNFRLQRSAQIVIPATMEMVVDWSRIEARRATLKQEQGDAAPTQFVLFAWCVVQAAKGHVRLLSALVNETTIRQYEQLHLGIAVSRPNDELLMARVVNSTALSYEEFVAAAREAIHRARDGQDQTAEAMQLSLTSMAGVGITLGIPVVVAPSVATLFIGAPYDEPHPLPRGGVGFRRVAKMVLTFDHRIMNGVGAARFLSDIRARVEEIGQ